MALAVHPDYEPVAINSRIETDEVLGPLPEEWEKTSFENTGRHYYVNHTDQSTTWIDPRTFHIRKHDINEIVAGELPYGWEEAFCEAVGIFYIDHNTQCHFLEAPWDPSVRDQYLKLKREHTEIERQIEDEINAQVEMAAAEEEIAQLEAEQGALEREIAEEGAPHLDENDGITPEGEHLNTDETDQVKGRLDELDNVNRGVDAENQELINASNEAQDELQKIKDLLDQEAAQRQALEDYITQLRNEVLAMVLSPQEAEEVARIDEEVTARAKEEIKELEQIDQQTEPNTDDLEKELGSLRDRLEFEQRERERLVALAEELEKSKEKNAANQAPDSENMGAALPEWVRDLNVHAQKSQTLRNKIARKEDVDPEKLGFKEKLAKFNAPIDESAEPPVPTLPTNPKSEFAVRPKETGFGHVDEVMPEDQKAELEAKKAEEDEVLANVHADEHVAQHVEGQ